MAVKRKSRSVTLVSVFFSGEIRSCQPRCWRELLVETKVRGPMGALHNNLEEVSWVLPSLQWSPGFLVFDDNVRAFTILISLFLSAKSCGKGIAWPGVLLEYTARKSSCWTGENKPSEETKHWHFFLMKIVCFLTGLARQTGPTLPYLVEPEI